MAKVQSQVLKNRIIAIYRYTSTYGNGSNADAARYQKITGILVEGKDHIKKSDDEWRSLKRIIESGELTGSDKNIASNMMSDLQDALGYIPQ